MIERLRESRKRGVTYKTSCEIVSVRFNEINALPEFSLEKKWIHLIYSCQGQHKSPRVPKKIGFWGPLFQPLVIVHHSHT